MNDKKKKKKKESFDIAKKMPSMIVARARCLFVYVYVNIVAAVQSNAGESAFSHDWEINAKKTKIFFI